MNELIQKLSLEHEKKPVWKNRLPLLIGWASLNFFYFFVMGLFGQGLSLHSTIVFPLVMFLVSFICWILLSQFLNQESEKPISLYIGAPFAIIIAGLVYENYSGHSVLHNRSLSITTGDMNCFYHSVLRSLLPAFIFPFIMKQFYVVQKNSALAIGAVHLTMMSLILTELRCANREMWHLILGHQFAFIGIGFFMLCFYYLIKKKVF
jgi:hypothetical protein